MAVDPLSPLVRHLLAIGALPFTVAVLVPLWIARRSGVELAVAARPLELAAQVGGIGCLLLGVALFGASLRRFAGEGQGTLAPWDPRGGSSSRARIASCAIP